MTRSKKPRADYKDYYTELFRGYGEDDHIKRVDGAPLKSFDDVATSRDLFGVFRDGVVMIDVDDRQSSDLLLHILDELKVSYLYQTTTRGCHVFFTHGKHTNLLKDKTHIMLACGLYADIKCRITDGTKLVKDGEARPVEESPNYDEITDLPYFLLPIHAEREFLDMRDGDSRNSSLYEYILVLLRFGLNKDEVRSTIRIINNFLLGDPFSNKQLDIILRDEAFPTNNDIFIYKHGGSRTAKLDYALFAKYLIEKYHIVKIDRRIYVYDDGVYTLIDYEKLNSIIMAELTNPTKNMRTEMREYIINYADDTEQTNYNHILFNNCIYDLIENKMLPITPGTVFLNKINHNYNDAAEPVEIIDTVLNNLSCGDAEVRELLLEIIGYTFYRRNKLGKFFVLVGDGSNGKSTYLDMIKYLLGNSNVSSVPLQDLVQDKFSTWQLTDKLLNIGDDIDREFVPNTGKFKKLVTGETVMAEKKGQDQYPLSYYGKFIFSCNEIPRINDKTDGLKRRMVIIPLNAKFDQSSNFIPFVDEQLQDTRAMEYLLKLSLDALVKLLTKGTFTIPQVVTAATEEYHIQNDTILQYLSENTIDQKFINEVYMSYSVWCHESNVKPEGKINFCKRIYKLGYDRKEVKVGTGEKRTSKYVFSNSGGSQIKMS